jgi:putative MATE family efflux protein
MPSAVSMLAQIAYQLVDLYFVARLDTSLTAGVTAAANLTWAVSALTQILSVATVALVSQACGRRDRADAQLVFNQGMLLALLCGALLLIFGTLGARTYMSVVAEDAASIHAGVSFLYAALPGFALSPLMGVASAGLRGTGIVKAPAAIYMGTVLLNTALAPLLVGGWGTNVPLGAVGAGLATTISVVCGVLAMAVYLRRWQPYVNVLIALLRPKAGELGRLLRIGLPAGGEFALLFLSSGLIYLAIQDLGPSAQAGYGIASRALQALLLPAAAVAFASAPIVGQSLGVGRTARVHEAFRTLLLIESALMLALFIVAQVQPHRLLSLFETDAATAAAGATFLRIVSWGLLFQGLIYACTTLFRGIGDTMPLLLSSAVRFGALALGAFLLTLQPRFELTHLWYVQAASIVLQALLAYTLLRATLARRGLTRFHLRKSS